MTTWIITVFLIFFLLNYATETLLEWLNLRHVATHGAKVPPPLQDKVTPDIAERARDYTLVKGRFSLVREAFGTVLVLVVLFSGVLPWLEATLGEWGLGGLDGPEEQDGAHLFVGFLVALSVGFSLVMLPFGLYSTFVIETRFGFNRQTWKGWLADSLKGLTVSAALGLPLLYGIHAFMAYTGAMWWVWVFAFLTVFQVVMIWLYPNFIAPIFNKFTPLPEGELKQRLEAMADSAGFKTRGLYVMDASRRSGHSNAYFTGFFKPRIVLFDTLVEKTPVDEALAVLAHEIGHYKARHIHKRMLLGLGGMLASLFVLSLLMDWPPLFQAFGFSATSFHAALALFALGSGAFTFFLEPLKAWHSRKHEYEADAYSIQLAQLPQALKAALVRLSDENLSNLHPHPWYSRYHYSHPTLLERLAAIDRL